MKNEEEINNSDQEINRKRKSNEDFQITRRFDEEENDNFLNLTLSLGPPKPRQSPPPQPSPRPPPPPQFQLLPSLPLYMSSFVHVPDYPPPPPVYRDEPPPVYPDEPAPARPVRARRIANQPPRQGKSETVTPPFRWATNRRATVHSLADLLSKQIFTVSGEVQCKQCEKQYEIEYDLREKFTEVGTFVAQNKISMHDRAPGVWTNPSLPTCKFCGQFNSVKPIVAEKKSKINWLFLLLGQMIGCCTLEQLKYFCKHTKNHRTGAKDRLVYLTYLSLCKQLDPDGPFDRNEPNFYRV